MKKLLFTCLLLICFSGLVRSQSDNVPDIKVTSSSGGIVVSCPVDFKLYKGEEEYKDAKIEYKDGNSGEYVCKNGDTHNAIYVKFRTCDNCIELDPTSISGLIFGDVVATFVIGVAVYLVAKQAQFGTTAPFPKKGSDKQHLVSNEVSNEHYQPLRPKIGQRDVYDHLKKQTT